MAEAIAAFQELPQHTQTFVWGEKQVRLRLTYRERTGSWYLDIFELDDTTLIIGGRRISPRWAPLFGQALGDALARDRRLFIVGAPGGDPYPRADLTQEGPVQLLLVSDSEIPDAVVDPNLAIVVVITVPAP